MHFFFWATFQLGLKYSPLGKKNVLRFMHEELLSCWQWLCFFVFFAEWQSTNFDACFWWKYMFIARWFFGPGTWYVNHLMMAHFSQTKFFRGWWSILLRLLVAVETNSPKCSRECTSRIKNRTSFTCNENNISKNKSSRIGQDSMTECYCCHHCKEESK